MAESGNQQIILKPAECCQKQLEFKVQQGWNGWEAYKPETAECQDCKTYFERKPQSKVVYKMNKGRGYNCLNCGLEILAEKVAHPIWDGPFPMSGSGKCHYETVPYCPKCEPKPDFHGTPIEVGEKFR